MAQQEMFPNTNTIVTAYVNEQVRQACEKYIAGDIMHFLNYLIDNKNGQQGGFTQEHCEEESRWKSLFLFFGPNEVKQSAITAYKEFLSSRQEGIYLPENIERIIENAIKVTHSRISYYKAPDLETMDGFELLQKRSYHQAQTFLEKLIHENNWVMSFEELHAYTSNMASNSYGFQIGLDFWIHQYK